QVQAFKNQVPNSKKAVLHYEHIGEIAGKHLIKVTPKTGRPHQIRVQLATLGCTILGDVKYGSNYKTPNRSLYLFCQQLGFEHPVKKEHTVVEAPWPLFGFWNTLFPVLKDQ
ncbi:MAG: RNA pseudouridine synthase, partial [Bacteroidetes bacterium]|nr:RNA pseudouridine synthase [Bacteroidota bacterium]